MYNKKFSIAHWDSNTVDHNLFYNCFENSTDQWKKEIYDIYFGATFLHRDVVFGDTMGVNASEESYKNLLKIQEKYGIGISLTLNEMNRPLLLMRSDIIHEFIKFIKKYYDDGVRSCTISHTHLMRTGALQEAFPDMDWKNTVNHRITSTQEFVDYVRLGYTTVQLDRQYNRNLTELKRTKKEADRLGVKTCLLVKENCMPECPFKTEHDIWQSGELLKMGQNYWQTIGNTCVTWREGTPLYKIDDSLANPRTGTDIFAHSKEDWADYANNVDIFKKSGRLASGSGSLERFGYFLEVKNPIANTWPDKKVYMVDSFKDIYENDIQPFHMWLGLLAIPAESSVNAVTDIDIIKKDLQDHFWNQEKAIKLSRILKNCRNQCYSCHKCDDLFETGVIESVLDLK